MKSYPVSIPSLSGQHGRCGRLRAALITAIIVSTALPSAAVPLPPGGSTPLAGIPGAPGVVVTDALRPFEIRNSSGQVLLSGNVQDRVVRLEATGDLSFRPRIRDLVVTAPGAGYYILELKVTGYGDTTIDVAWWSDALGNVAPSNASRDLTGDEVSFLYPSGALVPPSSSRFSLLETDAPAFRFAGRITITARNAAGETYSTTIEGTAAPTRLQVYPGGFIQPAIDAAGPGETVIVHAGSYTESITLRSGINVKGDGAGLVILRPPSNPGVLISNCVGTEFSGFTVTPAAGSSATTGIEVSGGSPLVKDNIVTGFSSRGISIHSGATALISGNRVQSNGSSGNGVIDYGILNLFSPSLIANNLISGNEVGCYIGWHESDGAQFINNTVVSNRNDGLWCYRSNPTVKNNIVTGNTPGISASHDNATPVLTYNNVWNNQGFGNYSAQQTGVINIGIGSLSVDPLFAASPPGEYQLAPASPCRDAGDPAAIYNDLDGSRNDMGWTGGPSASPEISAAPFGGFLFTSVGNIPANYVGADGLANVPPADAAALYIPAWSNAPFAGQPWLYGVFGSGISPYYYTVEYRRHNMVGDPWLALDHPLSKVKFTVSATGVTATLQAVGPNVISGVPYYLNTVNGGSTYWAHDSLRLVLNTLQLPDGVYDLRVRPFTILRTPIELSNPAHMLTLWVNNKPAVVDILSISKDIGPPLSECGIVTLLTPTNNLRFRITASHPDGFLDSYALTASVGRNRSAGTITSDSYVPGHSGAIVWNGVTATDYNTSTAMGAGQLAPWESCAYQFHLGAWSRATTGFTRVYYSAFSWNLALNLGGADLDGDGDVDGDDLNIMAAAFGFPH